MRILGALNIVLEYIYKGTDAVLSPKDTSRRMLQFLVALKAIFPDISFVYIAALFKLLQVPHMVLCPNDAYH